MQDHENKRRAAAKARAKAGVQPRREAAEQPDHGGLYALCLAAILAFTLFQATASLRADTKPAYPGDTLRFGAAALQAGARPVAVQANVTAGPLDDAGPACMLDAASMEQPGGVLTVLAAQADALTVNWAGAAAAPGPDACPAGADLRLSSKAYHALWSALQPTRPMVFH